MHSGLDLVSCRIGLIQKLVFLSGIKSDCRLWSSSETLKSALEFRLDLEILKYQATNMSKQCYDRWGAKALVYRIEQIITMLSPKDDRGT